MFTLEIYNQLVEDDLTRGHEIAGTGTINEKGEVGADWRYSAKSGCCK